MLKSLLIEGQYTHMNRQKGSVMLTVKWMQKISCFCYLITVLLAALCQKKPLHACTCAQVKA